MQQQIVEFFYWFILSLIVKSGLKFRSNPVACTYTLLLRAAFIVECASNCSISENGQSADCSFSSLHRVLHEIPQDLNAHISILDLSGNPFSELREQAFTRYHNLTSLMLRDIRMSLLHVDLYLFRPLQNLKVLNLTGSSFSRAYDNIDRSRAYFYWPISLRILDVGGLGANDIDLSQLKDLKELHARENGLFEFPTIHELAPLTHVDLDKNHLDNLSPERLAPFCKLQVLNVELDVTALLISSPARYCICKRANLWISSFKIKGKPLPCSIPSYGDQCEETFSEDTLSMYNECLERRTKKKSYTGYVIFAAILILLIVTAVAGYFFYYYYVMKPSSDETLQENDGSGPKHGSSKVEPAELEIE